METALPHPDATRTPGWAGELAWPRGAARLAESSCGGSEAGGQVLDRQTPGAERLEVELAEEARPDVSPGPRELLRGCSVGHRGSLG